LPASLLSLIEMVPHLSNITMINLRDYLSAKSRAVLWHLKIPSVQYFRLALQWYQYYDFGRYFAGPPRWAPLPVIVVAMLSC